MVELTRSGAGRPAACCLARETKAGDLGTVACQGRGAAAVAGAAVLALALALPLAPGAPVVVAALADDNDDDAAPSSEGFATAPAVTGRRRIVGFPAAWPAVAAAALPGRDALRLALREPAAAERVAEAAAVDAERPRGRRWPGVRAVAGREDADLAGTATVVVAVVVAVAAVLGLPADAAEEERAFLAAAAREPVRAAPEAPSWRADDTA